LDAALAVTVSRLPGVTSLRKAGGQTFLSVEDGGLETLDGQTRMSVLLTSQSSRPTMQLPFLFAERDLRFISVELAVACRYIQREPRTLPNA
jgi:hypothetical protein